MRNSKSLKILSNNIQNLHHLTTEVVVSPRRDSKRADFFQSPLSNLSSLRQLNLHLLDKPDYSNKNKQLIRRKSFQNTATPLPLGQFFYDKLILSNILLQLDHFYIAYKTAAALRMTGFTFDADGTGVSHHSESVYSTSPDAHLSDHYDHNSMINNTNARGKDEESELETLELELEWQLKMKSKLNTTSKCNLKSFGCEIVPFEQNFKIYDGHYDDDETFFDEVLTLMLNKYAFLLESLHFHVSPLFGLKFRFLPTSRSLLDVWTFSKDKWKDAESSKNLVNNENNCINWYPSNLRELCISNYCYAMCSINNVINNILVSERNIPKFSLLQISNSKYIEILGFLDTYIDSMIKSINKNRLNCIRLENITATIIEHATKQENEEKLVTFLQKLANDVTDAKSFVFKADFGLECDSKSERYDYVSNKADVIISWLNNNTSNHTTMTSNDLKYFPQTDANSYVYAYGAVPQSGPQTSKHGNLIIKLIEECFDCVSKLINTIDELMIVIKFDFAKELITKFGGDIIAFSQIVESKFDKLLTSYNCEKQFKNKVTCIMDSNGKKMQEALTKKENAPNYYFRLIFQSKNYTQDGGYSGPLNRLYSCPHCDKDKF